ncbi:limbin isoform X2 [Pipistrellus kuhlii]|uniref:limbin isoform X2 n=1 Tax=Pipistrellus kuhlii TaxID=59472 RepID=UPI001E27127A|nr:limbin isoform X2 [Pipistrellus kuhlii]
MGLAASPGRAAWMLAGGLLAAALALRAVPGVRGRLPGGSGPLQHPLGARAPPDRRAAPGAGPERAAQHGHISRDSPGSSEDGVIFQKCAVVSGPSVAPTAQVRLLVNNTPAPGAADLWDLLLLDNITGLAVREPAGNRTAAGLQAFRRPLLQVGDAFSVSYTASLEPGARGRGEVLLLPALLAFRSGSAASTNRTQLKALLTVTAEDTVTVLPNHGLHAAAFFVAFLASLALTWVTLFFMVRHPCLKRSMFTRHPAQHQDSRLEHSQFTAADGVNEDLALNDQMVGILSSEDPGSMLQALEELEIATLNRADSNLEACRTHISKDVIALLLRGLSSRGQLAPQAERRMGAAFKKQFLMLEKEVQEEYDRKMVALMAECDLETRKKTENQFQREAAAMEEAEELLKHVSERSAGECSSLLRTLHGLEQEQLRRALALQQEEDLARAHRQLAVFQRSELHGIFFAQVRGAVFRGDLQPEAAALLLQDYSRAQEEVEELMDFLQASKRCHLSKRFGHREYLVQNMQAAEMRAQGLLSAAAAQLTLLIQKHERAGYLDEEQTEELMERAQTEVFSIKQKLDNDLKQEKKKLHQKLIVKRRREMLQKHKEQRREQLSVGEAFRAGAAEDVGRYLGQWRSLAAAQGTALEELQERLDQAAGDELRALALALSEKAAEELRRLQSSVLAQELLKRGVPWLFLQQIQEEHARELAARAEQLEAEERAWDQQGVRGVRQRLQDDPLEASAEEQAELRHWGRRVFLRLCGAPLSLSEEELLRLRQDVHSCFAQMDRSLALPRARARVLLQRLHAAWREAELLRLDQALAAPELQPQPKARKPRARSRSKADLLRKCIEDKIQLFDSPAPEDLLEKVRAELRRERVQQLEAQEGRFAEALVALQFQKAARAARTLRAYTALLSVQDLLLEELSDSDTLTKAACAQILDSHSPELQELERKLEEELALQEAAQRQQWAGDGPGPLAEPEDAESEGQVSAALRRALGRSQELLERQQQSRREEQARAAVLEDVLETMEAEALGGLYGQELRLASYLARLTMVPAGTLRRLLSVALPAAPRPELLALLDSLSQRQPDPEAEQDGGGEQADLGRRGKHQGWWQALESRLREELRRSGLEKVLWARRRKESILRKPCPPLRERRVCAGDGGWPRLSLEACGDLVPVPIVGAEALDFLDTGEKLFIFRNPSEPDLALHRPPRRKKNFLNAKKAAWAAGAD